MLWWLRRVKNELLTLNATIDRKIQCKPGMKTKREVRVRNSLTKEVRIEISSHCIHLFFFWFLYWFSFETDTLFIFFSNYLGAKCNRKRSSYEARKLASQKLCPISLLATVVTAAPFPLPLVPSPIFCCPRFGRRCPCSFVIAVGMQMTTPDNASRKWI